MVKESELATPSEVMEAVDQARKELADKASKEILASGAQDEAHPLGDLYDHEIALIDKETRQLNAKISSGEPVDRDALHSEIVDRFAAIGFQVKVQWYYSQFPGVYIPRVEITGRVEAMDEFDHDRQSHEVVNDLLKTGERGSIRPGGGGLWTPGS